MQTQLDLSQTSGDYTIKLNSGETDGNRIVISFTIEPFMADTRFSQLNLVDEQGNSYRLLKGSGGETDAGAEEWSFDFEPTTSTTLSDSLNLTLSIRLAKYKGRDGAAASTLDHETPTPLEAELASQPPHDPRAAIIRAVIKKLGTSKSKRVHYLFTLEDEGRAAAIAANSEEVASFTFNLSVPVITARIGAFTHLNLGGPIFDRRHPHPYSPHSPGATRRPLLSAIVRAIPDTRYQPRHPRL